MKSPENWTLRTLSSCANQNKTKNKDNQENTILSLSYGKIKIRDISQNFGLLPESFETYQIISPGMIVMRLTDLQNDQRSLRVGISDLKGAITSAYIGLETKNDVHPKFLFYSLYHIDISKTFYTYGGGVRQSMSFNDFKDIKIPIPALSTQRAIATFLDQKTEAIDALIDKKQQLITLLEEQRVALINQAVTKGLDPDVPLKESGVEWIGRIPEHWYTAPLKMQSSLQTGKTPPTNNLQYYEHGSLDWYGPTDICSNTQNTTKKISAIAIEEKQAPIYPPKSILLICIGGTLGKSKLVNKTASSNQQITAITTKKHNNPKYFYYQTKTYEAIFKERALFTTMPILNNSDLGSYHFLVPPLAEQEAIAAYLDKELERQDAIIEKTRATIDKLTEYRQALITAAVTGQLHIGEPEDAEDVSPRGETTDEGSETSSQLKLC